MVVLTRSDAEEDIVTSYNRYANAYVTKPVDFEDLLTLVTEIENVWLTIVNLPGKRKDESE